MVLRSKGAAFTPPEGAVKNCETARVRVAVEACIVTATCLAQVANAMEPSIGSRLMNLQGENGGGAGFLVLESA